MRWSDISFHPDIRTLRQFALLWIVFFAALAVWQGIWLEHDTAAMVLGLIAIGGGLGFLFPRLIGPIYVASMVLAFPIGWAISKLILGLAYFAVFTPVAAIFRLIGRDALLRRKPAAATTYWLPKTIVSDPRRYFRQY